MTLYYLQCITNNKIWMIRHIVYTLKHDKMIYNYRNMYTLKQYHDYCITYLHMILILHMNFKHLLTKGLLPKVWHLFWMIQVIAFQFPKKKKNPLKLKVIAIWFSMTLRRKIKTMIVEACNQLIKRKCFLYKT